MESALEQMHLDLFGALPQTKEDEMIDNEEGGNDGSDVQVFSIDEEIEKVRRASLQPVTSFSEVSEKKESKELKAAEEVEQARAIEESKKQEAESRTRQQKLEDEENAEMERAIRASMDDRNARNDDVDLISSRTKVYLDCDFKLLEDAVPENLRINSIRKEEVLGEATAKENGRNTDLPYVQPIEKDGNCIPRSVLVSGGYDASDEAVRRLRDAVVGYMTVNPQRFIPLAEQGSTSLKQISHEEDNEAVSGEVTPSDESLESGGNKVAKRGTKRLSQLSLLLNNQSMLEGASDGSTNEAPAINSTSNEKEEENSEIDAKTKEEQAKAQEEKNRKIEEETKLAVQARWEARLVNMKLNGTFFEECEMQAVADLTQTSVILDALLSHNASVERHLFEPLTPVKMGHLSVGGEDSGGRSSSSSKSPTKSTGSGSPRATSKSSSGGGGGLSRSSSLRTSSSSMGRPGMTRKASDRKLDTDSSKSSKSSSSLAGTSPKRERDSMHLLLMMGASTAPHCEPVLLKTSSAVVKGGASESEPVGSSFSTYHSKATMPLLAVSDLCGGTDAGSCKDNAEGGDSSVGRGSKTTVTPSKKSTTSDGKSPTRRSNSLRETSSGSSAKKIGGSSGASSSVKSSKTPIKSSGPTARSSSPRPSSKSSSPAVRSGSTPKSIGAGGPGTPRSGAGKSPPGFTRAKSMGEKKPMKSPSTKVVGGPKKV